MRVIVGIDPDSNKSGIAVMRSGVLCELLNLNVIQLYDWLKTNEKISIKNNEIVIAMENPKGSSSSAYKHKYGMNSAVKAKISEKVGMVKQAQTSIEQMADALKIPIVLYKNSSMWKDAAGKKSFEALTGWTARSNEDTRSAAYFAYLQSKTVKHITKHNDQVC
jgi:Holliday junction resolvasome RuvABC endonuclease subunit